MHTIHSLNLAPRTSHQVQQATLHHLRLSHLHHYRQALEVSLSVDGEFPSLEIHGHQIVVDFAFEAEGPGERFCDVPTMEH